MTVLEAFNKIAYYNGYDECIEIVNKSLEAFEELKKILKMEITTDLKGNHYLFIDDIAVNDTIPITKEQADILKKGIYND